MSQFAGDISGQMLGRYRLESFLGEGGMGRVYRAFDPTLARPVAIKILPAQLVHDHDRLDRFVREARTASALNHPNVVTIYEIGAEGETHFIAMELLDGETLRERGKLELRRAIDLTAQIADGVAAAHSAGVIHRDLKPENIVITKSGFAKILDFGLAKLRESPPASDSATQKRTDPGTILGSAGYMSPEQAAGREVDHRTDIFSLGCILYEMMTGRRAFAGDSSIDTLHKILHDDPSPIRQLLPDAPAELQRIVRKCLAKDPDERYQSAKDLSIDLRTLRREVDSQPSGVDAPAPPQRRSTARWIGGILIAIVVVAALLAAFLRRPKSVSAAPMSITRITASGNVTGAAISPDGEYVVYVYSDAGKQGVWVKQLATGSTLNLVPAGPGGVWGVTFTPDSRSVYYALKRADLLNGALFQIPMLGGTPRLLLSDIESTVTFSPDGKRMAFTRLGNGGQSSIVVANADGTNQKTLVTRTPPSYLAPVFWGAPAWSADGKWIACSSRTGNAYTPMAFSAEDGTARPLSRESWTFVGQLAWLHDMSGLVLVGGITGSDRKIWLLSFPEGQRKQLTNDLFDYRVVTLSNDDRSLLTVAADQTAAVYFVPLSANARATKITSGKYDGLLGVAAAADGVIYTSLENDRWAFWWVDPSGANRRLLTPGDFNGLGPALSRDGRFIFFGMEKDRRWFVSRMQRDGSDIKTLCDIGVLSRFTGAQVVSPAPGMALFAESQELWKVPVEGGKPAALGIKAWNPAVSPDGRDVAYMRPAEIAVSPLAGGAATRTFNNLTVTSFSMVRWTPDGKALLHNAGLNERKNVWLQPLDSSPARPVTSFDDEYVLAFDVAPDGKSLAVVRGVLSRDAVLIKNFR